MQLVVRFSVLKHQEEFTIVDSADYLHEFKLYLGGNINFVEKKMEWTQYTIRSSWLQTVNAGLSEGPAIHWWVDQTSIFLYSFGFRQTMVTIGPRVCNNT